MRPHRIEILLPSPSPKPEAKEGLKEGEAKMGCEASAYSLPNDTFVFAEAP